LSDRAAKLGMVPLTAPRRAEGGLGSIAAAKLGRRAGGLIFLSAQRPDSSGSGQLRDQEAKSHRGHKQGDNFVWDKENTLEFRTVGDKHITFSIRDADKKEPDDLIGDFKIDLDVIDTKGHAVEWYDIYHKNKIIGQIQVESNYKRDDGEGIQGMVGDVYKGPQFIKNNEGFEENIDFMKK